MKDTQSTQNLSKKNGWRGFILWVLIAFFLRWQVIEPRWIPSGSMIPTIQIQDKILVEKISPRLRVQLKNKPKIGSIVVFQPPKKLVDAGYERSSALIKRVVGISGDLLEVRNGKLFRNGKEISEPWLLEPMNYEMKPKIVAPKSIWVLGDNRNNSLDSHLWGDLPEENLIGTAVFRYWPIKGIGSIRFPHPKELDN